MNNINLLLQGFANNIIITIISVIFPLCLGVLLTFLAGKSRIADRIFLWISLPFESICPVLLLVFIYYISGRLINFNRYVITIFTFSICFMFYMSARFVKTDSFLKNTLVNGIGLISTVFKWSFCVSFIGVIDLLKAANLIMAKSYNPVSYILPFVISLIIIFVLELAKRLLKQFLK